MSRTHAVALAVLLALNAVIGTVALTRTLQLGQASHTASNALVARRTAQLDAFEASLKAQLARKPLPKKPAPPATSTVQAAPAPVASSVPRVRYVRPAPIVVHTHRAGVEHEGEELALGEAGEAGDD